MGTRGPPPTLGLASLPGARRQAHKQSTKTTPQGGRPCGAHTPNPKEVARQTSSAQGETAGGTAIPQASRSSGKQVSSLV